MAIEGLDVGARLRARHRAGPAPGRPGSRRAPRSPGRSAGPRPHSTRAGADLPAAGEGVGGPGLLQLGQQLAGQPAPPPPPRRPPRRPRRCAGGPATIRIRGQGRPSTDGEQPPQPGREPAVVGVEWLPALRAGGRRAGWRSRWVSAVTVAVAVSVTGGVGCHRLGGTTDLVGRGVGVACSASRRAPPSAPASVPRSVPPAGVAVSGASALGASGGDRHRDRREGAGGGRQVDPRHPHSR